MKFLIFLLLAFLLELTANVKTPTDVYAEAMILKQMTETLRVENGINSSLPVVEKQKNKLPRHVLQKTLEILLKVDRYREINNLGSITITPVPSRDITPQDVYDNVERLKIEISYLLQKNTKHKIFKKKKYINKTPSDVYRELWSVSLGFDALIGQGFTPTDVYALSEKIVKNIKFLRNSQRERGEVSLPSLKSDQHPNHALYKSVSLIQKISNIEKKLWMKAVPVPKIHERVVSPTEVYDSLQTASAELDRISRRLGLERYFELPEIQEKKSSGDVVQNLEYALSLLPSFNFDKELNQYPKESLLKTPSDVFALSEFILRKLETIKGKKGISLRAKETSYIYGLKPIHVYVKGVEALEKIQKLKAIEGFAPSESPRPPSNKITPSEVYELILRLDDEITLAYASSLELKSYRETYNKKHYTDKTPSDSYDNLWKISYELDAILNQEYTPNETFILAKKIEADIKVITESFLKRAVNIQKTQESSKKPSDVFYASLEILDKLQEIKNRGNLKSVKTEIPKDKHITPTSVYNALRIISATLSEIRVNYGIDNSRYIVASATQKSPSDVYTVVKVSDKMLEMILSDSSYED